jgi:hypothetical protein
VAAEFGKSQNWGRFPYPFISCSISSRYIGELPIADLGFTATSIEQGF